MKELRQLRRWIATLVLVALAAHLAALSRPLDRAELAPATSLSAATYIDAILGPTPLCAGGAHAPVENDATGSEFCLFCQRVADIAAEPPAFDSSKAEVALFDRPTYVETGVSTLAVHLERGSIRGRAPPRSAAT